MKILIGLVVLAAMVSNADASTYKDLTYDTPSGWSQYPGRCRGACLLGESSKARIDIYTVSASSAMAAAKQVAPNPTKSQDLAVAGRAGAFAMQAGKIVAATAMGSEYLIIALEPSQADIQNDIAAWASIVDNGRIGGDAAPPPSHDYGTDTGPRHYTIKLVNVGHGCRAKMTWDGTTYELEPGETKQIETTEGEHHMTWTDNQGRSGDTHHNVPKYTIFQPGCVAPSQQPPSGGGGDASIEALAKLAALVVGNTYSFTINDDPVLLSTSYSFWTTSDTACPIAFSYTGIARGAANIYQQYNGCALIDSIADGQPAGTTNWRLVATYADFPADNIKGPYNKLIWQGRMRIYTNAIDLMDRPIGVFDLKKGPSYRLMKQ